MRYNPENRKNANPATLQQQVESLSARTIPMHMPGHKRRLRPSDSLPYELDLTEIDGADDLHDADGILKEAMMRAADLWGSRRAWFLVGGSTCGLLASIRAAAPFESEIIAARNCHRSVFHAIELGKYKVHWILPEQDPQFEICKAVTPDEVREALKRYPCSAAVILTSPTYEGILSDIRGISKICRAADVPLIVDEAHGAHLGLFEEGGFPDGAVKCGADIAVQSVHKTLPSLTQTAVLHLQGDLVKEKEIERQLGIFETSSPSYPLMISIDSCVHLLAQQGPELFESWKQNLDLFYTEAENLQNIKINRKISDEDTARGRKRKFDARDRSKILISFRDLGLSGAQAAAILRDQYGIEVEMSSGGNVLAMTGAGESRENLLRLYEALRHMDATPRTKARKEAGSGEREALMITKIRTACSILEAVNHPCEEVPLRHSAGRICGEYLYAYPPGIPILAPGEYIRPQQIRAILRAQADGNRVHHTYSDNPEMIACLAE